MPQASNYLDKPGYSLSTSVKTELDVLRSSSATIGHIAREKGESVARAALMALITKCTSAINVGKQMSVPQIQDLTNDLLEDFPHKKIAFFELCFKRAKKGEYGLMYDSVDTQTVYSWIRKCDEQMQEAAEKESINQHKRIMNGTYVDPSMSLPAPVLDENGVPRDMTPVPAPSYIKDLIKSIGNKPKESAVELPKTDAQLRAEKFVSQFNEIAADMPGVRFVAYKGGKYNISEFVSKRELEYLEYLQANKSNESAK